MEKQKEFPENRYKHCYSVGRKMYEYAKFKLNWTEEKAQEMFILGNLHDIGYEFDTNSLTDGLLVGTILEKNGYKYANEIKYHARLQNKHNTEEMNLLYYADLTVDGEGNYVTYDERLTDLENRYGKDSHVVQETLELIKYLKNKGFSDQ